MGISPSSFDRKTRTSLYSLLFRDVKIALQPFASKRPQRCTAPADTETRRSGVPPPSVLTPHQNFQVPTPGRLLIPPEPALAASNWPPLFQQLKHPPDVCIIQSVVVSAHELSSMHTISMLSVPHLYDLSAKFSYTGRIIWRIHGSACLRHGLSWRCRVRIKLEGFQGLRG